MTPISFEFFPAKTAQGAVNLSNTINELNALAPHYMSVTYGAGGTTQAGTKTTIDLLQSKNIKACPHLTCIGTTKSKIRQELQDYQAIGVQQLVILRGDLPDSKSTEGDFNYAVELIEFIRHEFGDTFKLHIAAYPEKHPESPNFYDDFQHFKNKVTAGADDAITQYFFNPDAYARFLDECEKYQIHVPIIPGIMPITNHTQLARFSKLCGAEIPRWLDTRLASFGKDLAGLQAFGEAVISRLCEDLIKIGATELHFYSMNKADPCRRIIKNLNL